MLNKILNRTHVINQPSLFFSDGLVWKVGCLKDAVLIGVSVFLVAFFTLYLSDSDDRDLMIPPGLEDNIISFVPLDASESPPTGGGESGTLTVSGVTTDGFDLSWKLKPDGVYDELAVEYRDTQRLWDVREVQLPGDDTGSRLQGLNASTEYQLTLYGVNGSVRHELLQAVAVTGINVFS